MKRAHLAALALLSTIWLAGCSDDTPTNTEKKAELIQVPMVQVTILPLKIGNRWTFAVTDYDSNGAVTGLREDSIVVLRDTTIRQKKWFVTNERIYRRDTNGVWVWDQVAKLAYAFPSVPGDTFDAGDAMGRIISMSERDTVPFGPMLCFHYRYSYFNRGGYESDAWLSTNRGFVILEESKMTPGGRWYRSARKELKEMRTIVVMVQQGG